MKPLTSRYLKGLFTITLIISGIIPLSTNVEASDIPLKISLGNDIVVSNTNSQLIGEASALINEWENAPIAFNFGHTQFSYSPSELGINLSLYEEDINSSILYRISTNLMPGTLAFEVAQDEKTLSVKINSSIASDLQPLREPGFTFDPTSNKLVLSQGSSFVGYDIKEVKSYILSRARDLSSEAIDIMQTTREPGISQSDVEKVITGVNTNNLNTITFSTLNKFGDKLKAVLPKDWRSRITTVTDSEKFSISIDGDYLSQFITEKFGSKVTSERKDLEVSLDTSNASIRHIDHDQSAGLIRNDGFQIDVPGTLDDFISALNSSDIPDTFAVRTLSNQGTVKLNGTQLDLIGRGRSDFATSAKSRIHNVELGMNKKFDLVYIAKDAKFQFKPLIGQLSLAAGWQMALGIFGDTLSPTMGGGLCQVATTVYRGALAAGLPIDARKPHSWWIHYYSKYGEGLDATVFVSGPNGQGGTDLQFTNDTGGDLLLISRTEGTEAITEIWGTHDKRTVALKGPYMYPFTELSGQKLPARGKNTIYWVREMTKSGTGTISELIQSSYRKAGFRAVVKDEFRTLLGQDPASGPAITTANTSPAID